MSCRKARPSEVQGFRAPSSPGLPGSPSCQEEAQDPLQGKQSDPCPPCPCFLLGRFRDLPPSHPETPHHPPFLPSMIAKVFKGLGQQSKNEKKIRGQHDHLDQQGSSPCDEQSSCIVCNVPLFVRASPARVMGPRSPSGMVAHTKTLRQSPVLPVQATGYSHSQYQENA